MPITGLESTLATAIESSVETEITIDTGSAPGLPNNIASLSLGIAKGIIPFMVANLTINPGIPVTTTPGVTLIGPPGGPLPIPPLTGSTSGPGTAS